MEQNQEQTWQALSEHVLTDMKEWRRVHPKATLREIEQEVHERMSHLEAQLIQDTAQQSASRDWKASSEQERPVCPVCGTALQARGKHSRTLQGAGGRSVKLTREYGTCPSCGTGLFPPG